MHSSTGRCLGLSFLLAVAGIPLAPAQEKKDADTMETYAPAKSPEESLAAIQVLPGFKVELVAAEPLVEDPVAFDWAPDGKLWVAEMRDYPNGISWNKPGDPLAAPGGRIKLLTDVDGDGRFDRATTFLDEVPFPNGVKAWRGGVLVTAAPTIFFAEDTDGNGRADKREVLFEGFHQGNQQHRANGLRWGLDNWLYVANGDSGGTIKSKRTGDSLSISGRDLRVRPDDGRIEAQSGQSQFGRCRDDWGNWFGNNNANPLWHYVLDDHYLRRNPHFASPPARRDVPEVAGTAPVFPRSRTLVRFNDFHTANRFTSACSPEIYRDQPLARVLGETTGHVFICEPVHNLVHHSRIEPRGATFVSRRADNERTAEFLASTDNWFRPVMARTGPDGALWIADMYRMVMEHPEWIPLTWQKKLDLRAGSDRGRIYRVSAADEKRSPLPRLDQLDLAGLIARLEHPNGWQRDMAQQILLWRNDRTAIARLEKLATDSASPVGRLHALCTLDGLSALTAPLVQRALADPHPGVRRHAVRLSEPFLNEGAEHAAAVVRLTNDADVHVRMQLAYSLGEWKQPQAGATLARLVTAPAADDLLFAAALSSLSKHHLASFATGLLTAETPPRDVIKQVVGIAANFGDLNVVRTIVDQTLRHAESLPVADRLTMIAGLLTALRERKLALVAVLPGLSLKPLDQVTEDARQLAGAASAKDAERVAAARVFGALSGPHEVDERLLRELLSPRHAPEVQAAAAAAIASRFADAPQRLLADWFAHSPALRAQILEALFSRPAWTAEFVSALEADRIPAAHVDARRRQQLVTHRDEQIRSRARKLFLGDASPRAEIVSQLEAAATKPGDAARGKILFAKKCAVCHKFDGVGQAVGPDLTALVDKSPRVLLIAILDPNRAVEDKFLDYIAVTADGRQVAGMIASETSTSLTLVGQEAKQVTVLRADLETLHSSGKSLMPEGIEKDISPSDIADLIEYVRK